MAVLPASARAQCLFLRRARSSCCWWLTCCSAAAACATWLAVATTRRSGAVAGGCRTCRRSLVRSPAMDGCSADKARAANRELVTERLRALRPERTRVATGSRRRLRFRPLRPGRARLDFDGSVLGTKRQAEGTAVGFNPRCKGQRSYWPLFATVARTSQALGVPHQPGNMADSTGPGRTSSICSIGAGPTTPCPYPSSASRRSSN